MATLGISAEEKAAIERFQREVVDPSMTRLVILQFTASWCGPCKQLSPILEKVAADYADKGVVLVKLDIDEQKFIAAQFRIQSVPTVYALFGGQPVADLTPYRSEGQIGRILDQLLGQLPVQGEAQALEAEIAPLIAMGEQVLAEGDAARAESIFRQIRDMDPDQPQVTGGLARALIAQGQLDEARVLLEAAPDDPALAQARAALDLAASPQVDVSAEQARLDADPDDHSARLAIANALIAAGERDRAADELLEIVRRDRDWNDGAARARFLQLLESAGLGDPWSSAQRRRLSALLFT